MKNYLKKIVRGLKAISFYLRCKVYYGSRVHLSLINSIKGKVKLELENGSNLDIGNFLMVNGPLFIKCCENAKISIGEYCFFNHNCSITCVESVSIGRKCMIANNVVIVDHDHVISDTCISEKLNSGIVEIGENVWVGANVVITKGVKIGNGSVVSAGAVVTKSIPSHELWGGVPAHFIKKL